jgi:hypothetical protein
MSETTLPPATLWVSHRVEDFDTWLIGFDQHEPARRAAGLLGHCVDRAEADPHLVTVELVVGDVERARRFAASDELRAEMERVGVLGAPEMTWATPLRDALICGRALKGCLVRRVVTDVDRWLHDDDAGAELRRASDIVGHAAYRSLDDPHLVIVQHQAESFATLEEFVTSTDEPAGATPPEVTFHTVGWARRYD